ncbi:MAG: phosphotransferase [Caldilineaceae bacterium]
MKTIVINDRGYELVCRRTSSRTAIYRGSDGYLRIGDRAPIAHELAIHKRLAGCGFPVAALLGEGEVDGQAYFIEADLGEAVFGERFDAEMAEHRAVDNDSFQAYMAVVQAWAHTQLRHPLAVDATDDFAQMLRLPQLQHRLPDLATVSEQAFVKIMARLRDFPMVWTHGDFHPYNVCAGGVIDLETTRPGIAGYDIITGILTADLFPPDPTTYRFTSSQKAHYFSVVDRLYANFGLPPPSAHAADYALCKTIQIVAMAEQWPSEKQQWVYMRYRTMVESTQLQQNGR